MLKTEEIYMEQNNKRMHEVTDPLYFVIEEKMNSVDFTDKGVDLISSNVEDPYFLRTSRHHSATLCLGKRNRADR